MFAPFFFIFYSKKYSAFLEEFFCCLRNFIEENASAFSDLILNALGGQAHKTAQAAGLRIRVPKNLRFSGLSLDASGGYHFSCGLC
jgi:hypothetical protein